MLPLRIASRRLCRTSIPFTRSRIKHRAQHDRYGPHKEYFQHPSQYPREFEQPHSSLPPTQSTQTTDDRSISVNAQSKSRRGIRIIFYIDALLAGFVVGTGLITWEYMQPPFEPGTEEYEELEEEIQEILEMDMFPDVFKDTQGRGPIPDSSRSSSNGGRHLVRDTLTGPSGLTSKIFRFDQGHKASATMVFAGDGLEGAVDTLHPGAIFITMHEAVDDHTADLRQAGLELVEQMVRYRTDQENLEQFKPNDTFYVLCHVATAAVVMSNDPQAPYPCLLTIEVGCELGTADNIDLAGLTMDREAAKQGHQQSPQQEQKPPLQTTIERPQSNVVQGLFTLTFSGEALRRKDGQSWEDFEKSCDAFSRTIVQDCIQCRPHSTQIQT